MVLVPVSKGRLGQYLETLVILYWDDCGYMKLTNRPGRPKQKADEELPRYPRFGIPDYEAQQGNLSCGA